MKTVEQMSTQELEQFLAERKRKENERKAAERKAYEEIREDLINDLHAGAEKVQSLLTEFKKVAFSGLADFYELLCSQTNRSEESKGNFKIVSADGLRKIEFNRNDAGYFDERADMGEKHIIEFVSEKFANDEDTKALVLNLLERKKGKLDIKLVQRLYKMEDRFDDHNWKTGIQLLKESWQIGDAKFYVNFYKKDESGEAWQHIALNLANV